MQSQEVKTKVTARIDKNLANYIKDNLYYGQQNLLFINLFKSIKILIQENRFEELTDYLNKNEPLILPAIKDND